MAAVMRKYLFYFVFCLLTQPSMPGFAQGKVQEEAFRPAMDADGKQRIRILGGDYFFKPSHIIVKLNVPVELSVSLEPGIVPHTLIINAPEAGIAIDKSLSTDIQTFVFTPKAIGKYPFYCKNKLLFFKSHQEKGMEGILEVVE